MIQALVLADPIPFAREFAYWGWQNRLDYFSVLEKNKNEKKSR